MLYITLEAEYKRLVAFYIGRGHDKITARSLATMQVLEMYS